MFGKGISKEGDILDLATNLGIVNKSGSWFAYDGDKIGQGRENAKQWLASHPDKMEEIDHKVRAHYQVSEDADATEETADSDKSAGKDVE